MPSSSLVIDLFKNVQKLSPTDFEEFFAKILMLRKSPEAGQLSTQEVAILQEINEGFSREKQIRFGYLVGKRDASVINKEEYQELLSLTEELESYDLKRLKLISQLAELRKLSLGETVEAFNLRPVAYG